MIKFVVIYVPFPDEIYDFVSGGIQFNEKTKQYNIFIDSRKSAEEQVFTLKHEYAHAMLGHLTDLNKPTDIKEAEADSYASSMTNAFYDALLSLSIIKHLNSIRWNMN